MISYGVISGDRVYGFRESMINLQDLEGNVLFC